jgi:hypothetical protein
MVRDGAGEVSSLAKSRRWPAQVHAHSDVSLAVQGHHRPLAFWISTDVYIRSKIPMGHQCDLHQSTISPVGSDSCPPATYPAIVHC